MMRIEIKNLAVACVFLLLICFFCAPRAQALTKRTPTNVSGSSIASPYQFNLNVPSGTVDGDIMFVWIAATASLPATTSGWTLLGTNAVSNGGYRLFARVANNEPASYTWTLTTNSKFKATSISYASGDFFVQDPATDITVTNVPYTTITSPDYNRAASFNVSYANSPLIFFGGVYNTGTRAQIPPSNPGTFIEDYDSGDTNSDFWLEISNYLWSGSGSTGNIDSTLGSSSATKHAFAVALNPSGSPTVTTQAASDIEDVTAVCNGTIVTTGGINPTARGCEWDTDSGAPYANSASDTGTFGVGAFTKTLSSLPAGTTVYARAFATNSKGTGYGSEVSFLTKPAAPTNVTATDGTYTDKVRVTWTKSTGATDYYVWRDSTDLGSAGDVDTFDDTGADSPTITSGSASASDGTEYDFVELDLSGASANNGTTHTYKVVASNATGNSSNSNTDSGYRGVGSLTYQWQRSAGDSDANYSNIDGAILSSYDDTGAPSNGDGRYYRCVLNATGAAQQISSADRGYRFVGSLSVDIVDLLGASVSDPTVLFDPIIFSWNAQQSQGVLGFTEQKVRASNTTKTPTWTLSISATNGPNALWTATGNNYDFNGTSSTGRLKVDASSATITPGSGCSTNDLTKGSATWFSQGVDDSINIVTAGESAQDRCYWDITGIELTQDIPASQAVDSYSIDMMLTIS